MVEPFFLFLLLFQPNKQNPFIQFHPSLDYQKLGYWMVEEELIPIIQQKLISYVQDQLGTDHNIIKNWGDYWFQVYGRTQPNGKKSIRINAYSRKYLLKIAESEDVEHPFNLRTRMVMVSHQSEFYFVVYLDSQTLAFIRLKID